MTKTQRPTVAHSLAKFSFLLLLIVGCSFAAYYFLFASLSDFYSKGTLSDFVVNKGDSISAISIELYKQKYTRHPLSFRIAVYVKGLGSKIQAGTYAISSALTPFEIAEKMTKGRVQDHVLTIPEGYRAEQIAETAGLPVKDFLIAAAGLEGQLFPDTYFVKEKITSPELVTILHNNFVKKVGEIDKDTLTLASLVERETKGDVEKPVVAGILKKRLASGWPLELDATIQYFLGKSENWWPNTTLLDRKLKSPYNTYLNQGLPPTPICNPGLISIQAAQNPIESSYWFYLHDKNGTIHYGATLEEHNQNISKYIR